MSHASGTIGAWGVAGVWHLQALEELLDDPPPLPLQELHDELDDPPEPPQPLLLLQPLLPAVLSHDEDDPQLWLELPVQDFELQEFSQAL